MLTVVFEETVGNTLTVGSEKTVGWLSLHRA